MKKSITYLFTIFSVTCMAQVTIDLNNFPRIAGFTDQLKLAVSTGVAVPSEGPAQIWNYSSLVEQSSNSIVYVDATADINFPNALNYFQNNLTFQGYPIPSNTYEAIDVNGWYNLGRSTTDVIYSIAAITGGAKDSLRFPGTNQIYNGRIDAIKFPMTYQSMWTESRFENSGFELSVTAFGLNKTPGNRKRILTNTREIVGYGQLKIPKSDGSPSENMDLLLMKIIQTTVDSFFLGGAPAPATLLTAFGLTQGSMTSTSFYIFYKPDFAAPVLNINLSNTGQVSSVNYRPQAADGSVSVSEATDYEAKCYPNPSKAGQTVIMTTSENSDLAKKVKMTDMHGHVIFHNAVVALTNNQYQLTIPVNFTCGLYSLQLENQHGDLIGRTKLLVK